MGDYEDGCQECRERNEQQNLEQDRRQDLPETTEVTDAFFTASSKGCDKDEKKKEPEKPKCRCQEKKNGKQKQIKSGNPFILFYLTYYYQKPSQKVTEAARAAGKIWCKMSDKEKEKYIQLAKKYQKKKDAKGKGC